MRREYATGVDQGTLLKCGMGNHEVGTVPGTFFLGVLDTILDGGESMKGKDEGTPKKKLGPMNTMVCNYVDVLLRV